MRKESEKRIMSAGRNLSYSGRGEGAVYRWFQPTGMEALLPNHVSRCSVVHQKKGRKDCYLSERGQPDQQKKWLPVEQEGKRFYYPPMQ